MKTEDRLAQISACYDKQQFRTLHEEMSFAEYLDRCFQNPRLIRTSYQRMYDMIMSKGTKIFKRYRHTYTHYNFFDEFEVPIIGLEDTLESFVKFIKGAAGGYGTEKRVLLLHGPVGSAKSTLCRILKKGLEVYSYSDAGAWYTFKWVNLPIGDDGIYTHKEDMCPMHDDPIRLIPSEIREPLIDDLNKILRQQTPENERSGLYVLKCEGELDPRSRLFMREMLMRYDGDWQKVITNHVRVVRMVHSEIDRTGIATFQPKDEKNQDSTELTGDINYAKLPHFGSDSDPRAFNYDGEFCVGNRGMVEFIEVLKLAKEFLYDLLGASQEQQIKPKKFSQIRVDTILLGHSVHGDTPVPHLYDGVLDVLPISKLAELERDKLMVFSVNVETNDVELTHVKNVFSHEFGGEWVENKQNGDCLTTTPNHSVYKKEDEAYQTFYPGEDEVSEIATVKLPANVVLNYPKTDRWVELFEK